MKDMLYAIIALVSVIAAVFSWMRYTASANTLFLVLFVALVLITIVCGALFLSGRVNKNEDIHITE